MNLLPRDRSQKTLFALFLLFFAASCINPPYLNFLLMQHVPTVLATALLAYVSNRYAISGRSFASIIDFLCLHTLGARYLYSYVPYDSWSETLLGINITDRCGFERNHYDRFVHFCYGLLMAVPVQELERRYFKLSAGLASLLAIEFILATSAIYEIGEWLIAVIFAPAWAESFLGQQGDSFDAQKDMALAFAGSVVSISIVTIANRGRTHPADDS